MIEHNVKELEAMALVHSLKKTLITLEAEHKKINLLHWEFYESEMGRKKIHFIDECIASIQRHIVLGNYKRAAKQIVILQLAIKQS